MHSAAGYFALLFIFISLPGQAQSTNDSGVYKRNTKLDKNKVPEIVTEMFIKEYPVNARVDWYGYPSFDNGSNWYACNPSYYSNQKSENYVVVFTHSDTLDKIIYNKNGKKIATHRSMNSALPIEVSAALKRSKYQTWKIGKDKEEIFKDDKKDQIKVYRITVKKENELRTLYFQQNGKMLKDVKLS